MTQFCSISPCAPITFFCPIRFSFLRSSWFSCTLLEDTQRSTLSFSLLLCLVKNRACSSSSINVLLDINVNIHLLLAVQTYGDGHQAHKEHLLCCMVLCSCSYNLILTHSIKQTTVGCTYEEWSSHFEAGAVYHVSLLILWPANTNRKTEEFSGKSCKCLMWACPYRQK